ncbi:unnamed protein product, partial [Ixodes hexagonus]
RYGRLPAQREPQIGSFPKFSSRPTAELQIPVPYGHLTAKEWLPRPSEDPSRRLICLHGHQDNAGSFDALLAELDPRWHAVALEFTGHGLSAHLPRGCAYTIAQYTYDVMRAVRFLGWERFCLMGHSLGGLIAHHYANLFSDQVKKLVILDAFGPYFEQASTVLERTRTGSLEFLRLDDKDITSQPSYTGDQMVQLYAKTRFGFLPQDVDALMKRGSRRMDDGRLVLTRDARTRIASWTRMDRAELVEYMKGFKNEMLVVHAVPGLGYSVTCQKLVADICRENCKAFEMVYVEGNHHVHMNRPDLVATHVGPFLERT